MLPLKKQCQSCIGIAVDRAKQGISTVVEDSTNHIEVIDENGDIEIFNVCDECLAFSLEMGFIVFEGGKYYYNKDIDHEGDETTMTNKEITSALRNAKANNAIQDYHINEDCDVYITINDSKFCIGSTAEDAMVYTRMKQYNIVK